MPVTLCIGGPTPQRLAGRTVRCQVCAIHRDSTMTYQIAITFDQPAKVEALREIPAASDEIPEPSVMAATSVAESKEPVNEW